MMRQSRCFTLVELMVVVVIIGICSSLLIPSLLSAREKAEKKQDDRGDEKKTALVQDPIRAKILVDEGNELRPKEAPEIVAAEIAVQLKLFYVLAGLSTSTHYSSRFDATFCVRRRDKQSDRKLSLNFPFPPGLTEARGVKFRLFRRSSDGEPLNIKELKKVDDKLFKNAEGESVFSQRGIQWEGALGLEEDLLVRIHYEAEGRDAIRYAINSGGRSRYVNFQLKIANSRRAEIPPPSEALKPISIEDYVDENGRGQILQWRLEDVITSLPVVVKLPSSQSPLGKMILLGQLAGLAVLIFGAGFFYLSEGYKPGQLDNFGWSHFLLLSVTYFMFFPVFAMSENVLGFWPAMGVGSVLSLPLFTYHVARYTDKTFALTRNLPFSVLTLIFVISGVYLEDYRPYVYTGGAVIIIFYLTIDLRSWIQKTEQYGREQGYKFQRQRIYLEIEDHWDDSKRQFNWAEGRIQTLSQIVQREELPENFEHLASTLERHQSQLAESKELASGLEARWRELQAVNDSDLVKSWSDYSSQLENLKKDLGRLTSSRGFVVSELERAQANLDTAAQAGRTKIAEKQQEMLALLSGIHLELGETSSLFEELSKDVERSELEGREQLREFIELEQKNWRHLKSDLEGLATQLNALKNQSATMLLRRFMGEARSLTWSAKRLKEKVTLHGERARVLESRWKALESQEDARHRYSLSMGGEGPQTPEAHCPACGASTSANQRFCAQCSLELPQTFACDSCGDVMRVFKHLLSKRKWSEAKLHCLCCGEQVGAGVSGMA